MMSVILFVDLLGARKKWQNGGAPESTREFFRFKKWVNIAARTAVPGEVVDGVIETDAAMLVCRSTTGALRMAEHLYVSAFMGGMHPAAPRPWFRGCVVPYRDEGFLRRGDPLRAPVASVTAFRYSESALEAVSVEKSGFKGMRLLVNLELVDSATQAEFRIPFSTHSLIPFRVLNHSYYPPRIGGQYTDYLWMACRSDDDWFRRSLHMTSRLRYAGSDPEEMAQAAATQIVFHECGAIRQSVIGRSRRTTGTGRA